MKEAITNLSKEENTLLQHLCEQHRLDPHTAHKTHKNYRQLRKLTHPLTTPHPLELLMKAAIVIAEQSQPVHNLQGHRVKGLSLALSQIITNNPHLRPLLTLIKLYAASTKHIQPQLKADLNSLADDLSLGTTLVSKFSRALQYFDLIELVDPAYGYTNLFQSFTWLFFLLMRTRVDTSSDNDCDYLLISVLYLMVRYSFDYLRPASLQNIDNNKTLVSSILKKLFSIFAIDHPHAFKSINAQVDQHFQHLITTNTIRCRQEHDFLSPALIAINYKKIDALYQRERNQVAIDYRLLLHNRLSTLTPAKHTHPTPRQQPHPDSKHSPAFASHKILTFDQDPEEALRRNEATPNQSIHHSRKQLIARNRKESAQARNQSTSQAREEQTGQMRFQPIKLPSNVRVSPSYTRTPLICAQRMSPNSSIQQFMNRQVKNNRYSIQILDNEQEVLRIIRQFIQPHPNIERLQDKVVLTYNYYLSLITKYTNQQPYHGSDLNGLHCSCLLHSLLFLTLASTDLTDQLSVYIRQLLNNLKAEVEASGYDLWIISTYLLKQRDRLPSLLKDTLLNLQSLCINELIWQQPTLTQIQHFSRPDNQDNSVLAINTNQLIERVLYECKNLIQKLIITLSIETGCRQLETDIYRIMKHIIAYMPSLLAHRHLHQILLTVTYRQLRTINIRFNDIILSHQQVNHIKNNEFKHIICEVYIEQDGEEYQGNIIQFFNQNFLPFCKGQLSQLHQYSFQHLIECYHSDIHEQIGEEWKGWPLQMKNKYQKPRVSIKNNRMVTQPNSKNTIYLKQNHTMTEPSPIATQINRHSSPILQLSNPNQQKLSLQYFEQPRDQTKQRARPSQVPPNCLRTEKMKSPTSFR